MPLSRTIISFLKKNRVAIGLLSVVWATFFSPLIVGGKIYFLGDLKILYLPIEYWYAQAQRVWELPIWSPYFGFGQPTIAWGQLGFFTPLHVLLRALYVAPLELLQVSVMAYFALGLLGMFLWLRRHVSSLAAALGSIVFVFSGFNIGHLNHVNFYTATMLLPFLLLAIDFFIARPTLRRALLVSLAGASLALSGQPQVVAYSYAIAVIVAICFGAARLLQFWASPRLFGKVLSFSVLAAVLAFCLASFAILPLYEFLPITERNSALPEAELFEFSYPPYYGITLIFPYFFGDYDHYDGPKSFQELAAFVGIIPLLLGGIGLFRGKKRPLQIAALILIVSGIVLMLGRYSPLYVWLVREKILTSLTTPGRFIFFLNMGIALAASLGLDRLTRGSLATRRARIATVASMIVLPVVLLGGFFWQSQYDTNLFDRLLAQASLTNPAWWLVWMGTGLTVATLFLAPRLRPGTNRLLRTVLVALAAATLVTMAWNYNPRSDRHAVGNISPFIDTLKDWRQEHGQPARLFSDETILAQVPTDPSTHYTERIGPNFAIHQELVVRKPETTCLQFPVRVNRDYAGVTTVALRTSINNAPIESFTLAPDQILNEELLPVCFTKLPEFAGQKVVVSFASTTLTPLELTYTAYTQAEEPVYFVRKPNATPDQLQASRKAARLVFTLFTPTQGDQEGIFLARHLQVLGEASSAQWVGALAIGNYRDFIGNFFANGRSAIDGDGIHALVRFRDILNMAGVTHLSQTLPLGAEDGLVEAGFSLLESHDVGPKEVRLYTNPAVLPKAFMVARAVFKPAADETRFAMQYEPYAPTEVAYVTGTKPPPETVSLSSPPLESTVNVREYHSQRVDVDVTTSREAFLVVTDATTPQWQTFIDDQPASYYVANTIFKAALVPAGKHTVSFRYYSPAIALSKKLTIGGLIAVVVLWLLPSLQRKRHKSGSVLS